MALSGISPPVMNWGSTSLPTTWEKFERHIKLIFSGPLKDKTEEEEIAFLLIWVGEKGQDISQSWTLANDEQKQLETYLKKIKTHSTKTQLGIRQVPVQQRNTRRRWYRTIHYPTETQNN